MQSETKKTLGYLSGFIGVVGTVAGILTLPEGFLLPVVSICVIGIAVLAMRVLFYSGPRSPVLDKGVVSSEITVRRVRDRAELAVIYTLARQAYGERLELTLAGYVEWWEAYPQGVFVITQGNTIIGSSELWPLTEAAYDKLINGELDDDDISGADIDPSDGRFWYVGDIVLVPPQRKTRKTLSVRLLVQTLELWLSELPDAAPESPDSDCYVRVCAIPFTVEGLNLLKRMNMRNMCAQTPGRMEVYAICLTKEEVRAYMASLKVRLDRIEDKRGIRSCNRV